MRQARLVVGDLVDVEEAGAGDVRGLVLGAGVAAGGRQVPAGVEDAQVRGAQVRGQPVGRDQELRVARVSIGRSPWGSCAGSPHSREQAGRGKGGQRPAAGSGRLAQDREEGRRRSARSSAGPCPTIRSSASRSAGRRSAIFASVVAVQLSGLPRPSAPRASATCAACSRSKSSPSGWPARRRRAGCTGGGALAGQHLEEGRAEALELDRADAGDAAQRVEGLRAAGRHLDQRAVGEDDVGRHAGGVGERRGASPSARRAGPRPPRRPAPAARRATAPRGGAADAVGAELERRLAAQQRAGGLGQAQRAVARAGRGGRGRGP